MLVHKESEELLNLLVNPFSLSIHLQVIGHGSCYSDPQKLTQRFGEVQYELCSSITDHFSISSSWLHMIHRVQPKVYQVV